MLCSGKVYYDLFEERAHRKQTDVFFLRLEQLYPFPDQALLQELGRFPHVEVTWCQEEPTNMGAWSFVQPRIEEVMEQIGIQGRLRYVGRAEAASPATGSASRHAAEQRQLVDDALTIIQKSPPRKAAPKKAPARKAPRRPARGKAA